MSFSKSVTRIATGVRPGLQAALRERYTYCHRLQTYGISEPLNLRRTHSPKTVARRCHLHQDLARN